MFYRTYANQNHSTGIASKLVSTANKQSENRYDFLILPSDLSSSACIVLNTCSRVTGGHCSSLVSSPFTVWLMLHSLPSSARSRSTIWR